MAEKKLKLGMHVKDTVTGFEGTLIGIAYYLEGKTSVGIKPDGRDRDGQTISSEWFYEGRVVEVENGRR